MDLQVEGAGPSDPFLGAKDLFSTEYDLDRPVIIDIRADPDERMRVHHDESSHTLVVSQQTATSAMARELSLHEFAHMHHHECSHPSHTLATAEVIFLALSGESVPERTLTHCYQIANHTRDIYADDVWIDLVPATKLVDFFEASLATAVDDRSVAPRAWTRVSGTNDPEITVVNAAFALALLERHGLAEEGHRIYDLAHAAAADAPHLGLDWFRRHFRALAREPTESALRKSLVDLTRTFVRQTRGTAR